VVELLILALFPSLHQGEELPLLRKAQGSLSLEVLIVADQLDMFFDEGVLVTLISIELPPVLADEIILEVSLICVVFLDQLARKVHYFEVREGGG
jgi:hypothetical protein